MLAYIIRRLLLIPLTLLGIITVNFFIVQIAPGGPVEQMLAQIQGSDVSATAAFSGGGGDMGGGGNGGVSGGGGGDGSAYAGARGLDPAFIAEIEKQFGFDKPIHERYLKMLKDYATFDLGESYYRSTGVMALIWEKMPVSVSLGVWSTLIIYLVSIPLGIGKAVRDGTRFDMVTSWIVIVGYAVPAFLFAILLIILFAHGGVFDLFPLRGLTSENWADLSPLGKVADYAWHLVLPVTAMVIGGFASLTMLTKNSFLEEINKQYVVTARAKGLTERRILYGHIFRNAMLLVVAGFPAALVGMLFTGSLLIEVIFSLDGLGLLGFESVINRDYPVMFGTLYVFGLLGLVLNLISDVTYHVIDPRIDFESREV
ncbi:microcin C ABC transporter permease YejB [Roseospira marina]|uniref:Microcin C ABC transporter permease YejB n=1 Tax=Roseospira marina TaxID=140057 RepID=A0A5M6IDG5_9PROT|nr:microcin C ABC transporter permease YejB [Roseospira marina]KAA5605997.1 microcin C ABC transporter permease YejB [Roseospira marina]MBB4313150.1 microcin C transport system permease protein [Roseospira marina]MBB5086109.1 microcin C transport system permease protein [Roseospira marina]